MEGLLEIGTLFDHLVLLVIEAQRTGLVNGGAIFDYLKSTNARVLGPNVGEFLYRNQHLIPAELWDGKIAFVFWGEVSRYSEASWKEIFHCSPEPDSDRDRYVRYLYCKRGRWAWSCRRVDADDWHANYYAVVLKEAA